MTEVLTGFSRPEFDFVGERNQAPDFVDIAGKLSAAAERAIMAEGNAVAEVVMPQQEDAALSCSTSHNYPRRVSVDRRSGGLSRLKFQIHQDTKNWNEKHL